MDNDDARTILQSTQSLRTHWSGVITQHIGFVMTIILGIWTFFLKAYVDSPGSVSFKKNPWYIIIATILSAIFLILWRLYARYLDNAIANLFSTFIYCESILGLPDGIGTVGYLLRIKSPISRKQVFTEDQIIKWYTLCPEQKSKVIEELFNMKRIGARGHFAIDMITFVTIILMFICCGLSVIFKCYSQIFLCNNKPWHIILTIFTVWYIISIIIIVMLSLYYLFWWYLCQKDPRDKDLIDAFAKAEKYKIQIKATK